MSTSKMICRIPSRRLAALAAVAALLLSMPAAAAPATTDAAGSWSLWDDAVEWVSAWFGWTQPTVGRASDAKVLGSTLDPDGKEQAPTDPTATFSVETEDESDLGPTLDPDG